MNEIDTADQQIIECLNIEKPKSFFLFAGAGSGKTRSLVNALLYLKKASGDVLRMNRKGIAVVTYTNAACDEINHRLDYNRLFTVVTIHSFVWTLIQNYQADIKKWMEVKLKFDIKTLQEELSKGRAGTKAQSEREAKLASKTERLSNLNQIKKFIYSPTGDNRGRESLNHSDVIEIAADFLEAKPLMQEVLISQYPILFIDESQDTKARFLDVLFKVQAQHSNKFAIGLFGDTMQRIYSDGKRDLGENLPADWLTPAKTINYRCPTRVVQLINKIRKQADQQIQTSPDGKESGFVRLFILNRSGINKTQSEKEVREKMVQITGDINWSNDDALIKVLTLEHHMAAMRKGFAELFEALSQIESSRTSLLDGTLPGLRFFTDIIIPIITAHRNNNKFEIARIVKINSPKINSKVLSESENQSNLLKSIQDNVATLLALWENEQNPKLIDVLSHCYISGLFYLPDTLISFQKTLNLTSGSGGVDENDEFGSEFKAWETALNCDFDQVEKYYQYISGASEFDTHQGVKGLEFPRVMVIIDDEEARGFMFSYDKIFGTKEKTAADLKNISDNKETSIDRTLRLFYVACSRAEKSLAVVAYTDKPEILKDHVLKQGWFDTEEIIIR